MLNLGHRYRNDDRLAARITRSGNAETQPDWRLLPVTLSCLFYLVFTQLHQNSTMRVAWGRFMSDDSWREQWRSEGGDLPTMDRCPSCYSEMPALATKCLKCSCERRWHFKVTAGMTTFLSLLIALLSVASTSIPILTPFMSPKDSKLNIAFLGASPDGTLDYSALNTGREITVLSHGTISIKGADGETLTLAIRFPKLENKEEFRTFKWNDIKTVTGRPAYPKDLSVSAFLRMIHQKGTTCSATLIFFSISGDHASDEPFDCVKLEPLARSAQPLAGNTGR